MSSPCFAFIQVCYQYKPTSGVLQLCKMEEKRRE